MNKPNKHIQIKRTEQELPEGKWGGEGKTGKKEDQLYGDEWKLNFWWLACCTIHRSRNIMFSNS